MAKASVVNCSTGEVFTEPPFVKLYYQAVASSAGLTATECEVWMYMISRMDDGNVCSIGKTQREQFLEKTGYSKQNMSNIINRLTVKGFLRPLARAEYLINPRFAAKTKWEKVSKIIWIHEFSEDGVTIKTSMQQC